MAKRIRGLGRLVVVSISPVRDADAARAVEYASLFGGIEHTAVSDRETVPTWAAVRASAPVTWPATTRTLRE